ncbi:hypothetical protein OPW36_21010 [Vibrio europaeus]|uniref:Accessory cholera enterotoxin n=1 Tax=Vibrio europaeus TaxID=300876 RepID=A0A178JG46_9VIBR|nr:hypothetical protein [Vibrio europaeus]MDC5706398.1 hypothetical protein [Vibrio europaeus]MDC5711713.1 hypothetical protein [Vibrio europaeus]MDC5716188.1 hypothetical protein [Vibrio europaeus]MDC5723185.1 hypothetical protein [Vibrio europaeus]MDC5728418.1 hypothetical protein [Vibrio europaeus]
MDYIYQVLEFLSGVGSDVKHFVLGIPEFLMNIVTYFWYFATKFYLTFKLWGLETAYKVATMLLQNYEVYTVLNAAFNKISPDLRAICHAIGVVDAIRVIIDAFATAFVLRIMGW